MAATTGYRTGRRARRPARRRAGRTISRPFGGFLSGIRTQGQVNQLRQGVRAAQAPRAPAVPHAPGVPAARPAPQAPGVARKPGVFIPDAQYLAGAAQRQFERNTHINELTAEGDAQRSMMQESVRRLMEVVPEQRQGIKEGANRQGLFYSGQLGKSLGDLETQVARQRGDIQREYDTGSRAREAARTAILRGAPLEEAAAKAEAVQRQIERDQGAASRNALVPTPKPKAAAPKAKPKPAKPKRRRPRRANTAQGQGRVRRRRRPRR